MIDRTQLTEALAVIAQPDYWHGDHYLVNGTVVDAARFLLDFPTDQQVEAACQNHYGVWFEDDARMMRKTLEAVRDTMIGADQ